MHSNCSDFASVFMTCFPIGWLLVSLKELGIISMEVLVAFLLWFRHEVLVLKLGRDSENEVSCGLGFFMRIQSKKQPFWWHILCGGFYSTSGVIASQIKDLQSLKLDIPAPSEFVRGWHRSRLLLGRACLQAHTMTKVAIFCNF